MSPTIVQSTVSKSTSPAPDGQTPVSPLTDSSLRLNQRERFVFLDQFAILIDSGIQIPSALAGMRQQCDLPRLTEVLRHLEREVSEGRTLSSAMEKMPRAFPKVMSQMVKAGESAGILPEMLNRALAMQETEAELSSKLRSAMLYPAMMVFLTGAIVAFLMIFIIPKFQKLFAGKQAELPLPTQWLMSVGSIFTEYGWWILAGLAAATIGCMLFLRSTPGKNVLDRVALHLPIVSPIYRAAIITRSSRTLGLLLQSGVPMVNSLEYAGEVSSSPTYLRFWQSVRHKVVNGETLFESMRGSALLPRTFQQVIAAGETSANLDTVFLKTASHYTKYLERKIRDLVVMLEPAMIIVMGGIVGFIALSIMLPIFRLSRS